MKAAHGNADDANSDSDDEQLVREIKGNDNEGGSSSSGSGAQPPTHWQPARPPASDCRPPDTGHRPASGNQRRTSASILFIVLVNNPQRFSVGGTGCATPFRKTTIFVKEKWRRVCICFHVFVNSIRKTDENSTHLSIP